MPYNYETAEVFHRPGVNPQSMDPAISGDSYIRTHLPNAAGQHFAVVVDGAWVTGFEHPDVKDIAQWSSLAVVDELTDAFRAGPGNRSLRAIVTAALPGYRRRVADLRKRVGYHVIPPAPYQGIDPAKIGPQCAFVAALFHPEGSMELAHARDCKAVLEYDDGMMLDITPDQSEITARACEHLDIQHEGLGSYQAFARHVIVNEDWQMCQHEIRALARKAHKPEFFKLWLRAEATLPPVLNNEEDFALWRKTFDTLCLCHNSWHFLNNPDHRTGSDHDNDYPAVWAMFTGEETMLRFTSFHHLPPERLKNVNAVWLMSDGAFKQGDRGEDLDLMKTLGPEKYYQKYLLPRFDNSTHARKRYAEDRVPMDVTILRLPL